MGDSKFYVELDDKSLVKWFRKQAVDYFKGEVKTDFEAIIKEAVNDKLEGNKLLEIVKQAIREVLPVEKIIRNGMEVNGIKKDWILKLVNDEIANKIKEAMPRISIVIDDELGELFK